MFLFPFFVHFLFLFREEVAATSGIGGTNITSSSLLLQASRPPIKASSSDKTAKKVDNIEISVVDNSSPKAMARVDARTI